MARSSDAEVLADESETVPLVKNASEAALNTAAHLE
jgi:hypothetical protein